MGCMFPEAENVARFWANIRHRLDAIRLERFVGHVEEFRQSRADRRNLYLEFVGEDLFNVDRLLARRTRSQFEFGGREDCVGN